MKFTYRLFVNQDPLYPAFFSSPSSRQNSGELNRQELNRAVEQLNAGADVTVIVTNDQVAVSKLIFELTSRTVRVSKTDASMPIPQRTFPGHLFIFFPGFVMTHKVW